jgi:hypothetical protein
MNLLDLIFALLGRAALFLLGIGLAFLILNAIFGGN